MNIFGVGPLEFVLFLLVALLILGPERMISASRGVARFIRRLITSPSWRTVQQVQTEMRNIPDQLIREAGLDDIDEYIPTPEDIAQDAGLDELSQQVTKVQQQVRGNWREINTLPVQSQASPSRPAPASPPGSGIPTVASSAESAQTSSQAAKPESKSSPPAVSTASQSDKPPTIEMD